MNKIYILLILVICFSCQETKVYMAKINSENYKKDTIFINPDSIKKLNDTLSYEITDLISLELPNPSSTIDFNQIKITKERIYVLDQNYNKTVYVFDHQGKYLFSMGKFGHARNEFVDKPTNFDVDETTGDVYIYERNSAKILVFNKNGEFVRNIGLFNNALAPSYIALTDDKHFLFTMDTPNNSKDKSLLSLYNHNMECEKVFLEYSIDKPLDTPLLGWSNNTFFHDRYIAYTPLFSDSVLLFSGNNVDKVLKVDFDDKFITNESIKEAFEDGSFQPIFDHKGVQFIERCEVTDSLIYIRYVYDQRCCNYVQYLSDKRFFNTHSMCFTTGLFRCQNPTIYQDKIVYPITKDDVEEMRYNKNFINDDEWNELMKHTKQPIKDLIDGKILPPVLMMTKLK